jgi:hypothetical protein
MKEQGQFQSHCTLHVFRSSWFSYQPRWSPRLVRTPGLKSQIGSALQGIIFRSIETTSFYPLFSWRNDSAEFIVGGNRESANCLSSEDPPRPSGICNRMTDKGWSLGYSSSSIARGKLCEESTWRTDDKNRAIVSGASSSLESYLHWGW